MSEQIPTIGSLLEFDFERPTDEEIARLREYGGLIGDAFGTPAGLAERFWVMAGANVFKTLGTALGRPLTELIVAGWKRYEPFLEFRNEKLYPRGKPVQKELLSHTIDASLTPRVKVLLNQKDVGTISFKFVAALQIEAGTLTIQDKKFMSLRPGKCWATATLTCAGKTLIERKTSDLVLPGELRFGDGIPIAPDLRI